MRKPFVAGNWKMNKTVAEARQLVAEMAPGLQTVQAVEQVLCPPFTSLVAVSAMLAGTGLGLGAQNMYWEESGAYTGEISPAMVAELCGYVILGHSERRTYFGETDRSVNRKVLAALAHNLIPIMCVGETLAENAAGETTQVVTRQVREGLQGVAADKAGLVVVAYEPVWAIGTGKAATGEGANAVVRDCIRKPIADLFDQATAQAVRVLYGGSVTPANAAEFFSQAEIDGALVGGASLKPDYIKIVQAAVK
jgi:triosephosphate isomerase (TIM)